MHITQQKKISQSYEWKVQFQSFLLSLFHSFLQNMFLSKIRK